MGFIQEIDALYIYCIVGLFRNGFLGELLNIDHRDRRFAGVVDCSGGMDVFDEVFLGIDFLYMKSTSTELIVCLCQ